MKGKAMSPQSPEISQPAHAVPLTDLARRLVQDGLGLARAETALARARIAPQVRTAKVAMVLLLLAAIIGLLSAIGLVVGLVLALSAHVGPLHAALAIGGAGLATAALFGLIGASRIRHLLKPVMEKLG
jgi:hypothetical protein